MRRASSFSAPPNVFTPVKAESSVLIASAFPTIFCTLERVAFT